MERYKTIHENAVMINPPEEPQLQHKPGSSYTEHELGAKPKEWKRVPLPDRKTIQTPVKQSKRTPLDWNWTAIITYSIIGYIAYRIFCGLYYLIFKTL